MRPTPRSSAARGAAFIPLPGSRREVQDVAVLFDQNTVLLGWDADEPTLNALRNRGELGTFAVIHLATHGEMDDLCPMNSRLLLSQDRISSQTAASPVNGPAFDGILSASEVMGTWKLKAELVTLSTAGAGWAGRAAARAISASPRRSSWPERGASC